MTRLIVKSAATSRVVPIGLPDLPTTWTTLVEAVDYSIRDTNELFPERDPADATRRIQPGQARMLTPLIFANKTANPVWFEVRILDEFDVAVIQSRQTIPAMDSYMHPIAGFVVTKLDLTTTNGGRVQARAGTASALDVTGAAGLGSSEQDTPISGGA